MNKGTFYMHVKDSSNTIKCLQLYTLIHPTPTNIKPFSFVIK